ncbi:MAG: thiamine-phosphate kinase [Casimicrobium sp.]|jgi:thiamine-monophosphate kinase
MTEFELIARYFARPRESAIVGNGDDCAVIAPSPGNAFAVTTDTLVEGRHFLPAIDPYKLGRRAVHVNLSDLAAMGAKPRYALLSLTLPTIDEAWIAKFSEGLWAALDQFGVELIGGNTTRGPLAIALTAMGELPPGEALLRGGAKAGDELWVSGALGDAGWALYCLIGDIKADASSAQIAKYECPEARVSLGVALRGVATSCIDISDGLLSEAAHLAEASGITININFAAVPTNLRVQLASAEHAARARHCLLSAGDAYELLFTAPVAQHAVVAALLRVEGLDGACIGRATVSDSAAKVRVLDAQSRPMAIEIKGWDHFA